MEKELQSKLVEILSAIQAATGKAADFTMAQLPDIAQQYVIWGRAIHTSGFIVSFLALLASLFVAMRFGFLDRAAVVREGYDKGDWLPSRMLACAAGCFGCLVFALALAANFGQFAMVWFAPKVWLLKELAQLVN